MNQALKFPNAHLARRAAEFFLEKGISEDATFYWRAAKDSLPWNVQLTSTRPPTATCRLIALKSATPSIPSCASACSARVLPTKKRLRSRR
jgi:hypothetical protein